MTASCAGGLTTIEIRHIVVEQVEAVARQRLECKAQGAKIQLLDAEA
jgi:hypothetical protein